MHYNQIVFCDFLIALMQLMQRERKHQHYFCDHARSGVSKCSKLVPICDTSILLGCTLVITPQTLFDLNWREETTCLAPIEMRQDTPELQESVVTVHKTCISHCLFNTGSLSTGHSYWRKPVRWGSVALQCVPQNVMLYIQKWNWTMLTWCVWYALLGCDHTYAMHASMLFVGHRHAWILQERFVLIEVTNKKMQECPEWTRVETSKPSIFRWNSLCFESVCPCNIRTL